MINKILKEIENGKNVFITGNAGTGKSYLLQQLKNKYRSNLVLTSTTGLAAVNIKGVTIHSWAGVGLCRKPVEKCVADIQANHYQNGKIVNCSMLAIDEISMLNGETLTYIDHVLRLVRRNHKPFGGIQVLFFGDFYQLPPVEINSKDKYFCFETPTWQELDLKVFCLETIYRQNEKEFIKALNDIRQNKADRKDIELLKKCEDSEINVDSNMLHIFAINSQADKYNSEKFKQLESAEYSYIANYEIKRDKSFVCSNFTEKEERTLANFKKNCRAEEMLRLKRGCRVMLLINLDFESGLINGSCGTVVETMNNKVIVKFDNGVQTEIMQHEFEYYFNDEVQAKMIQYPLKLAYAITIHKSQGLTLDNIVVDCSKIFEEGQTYVALSRVKTLKGLHLINFNPQKIKVNEKVVEFYKNIL